MAVKAENLKGFFFHTPSNSVNREFISCCKNTGFEQLSDIAEEGVVATKWSGMAVGSPSQGAGGPLGDRG